MELSWQLYQRISPDPRVFRVFTRLHGQIDQMIFLNGWYGSDIVVQRAYPNWQGEITAPVGYQGGVTSRCSTKAILAFVGRKQLLRYFASRAHPARTERTITDFKLFQSHLLEVAERGYALDLTETEYDYCGVAAPFFTASGSPLGSFGVAVPLQKFDHERESLIQAVTQAGAEASRALGHAGPYPPSARRRRDAV